MKRLLLIICSLLLVGCTNSNSQIDMYNRFINKINQYDESKINKNLPFDINISLEKVIDSELTYRVIIDNPKEPILKIKAIAVHDYKDDNVYPSSGIFEAPLNLIPNDINMNENKVKGVILVGYIDFDKDVNEFDNKIKVLIEYEGIDGKSHNIYYEYHK